MHDQCRRVIGGTTHTDPGGGWPADVVLSLAAGTVPAAPPVDPPPAPAGVPRPPVLGWPLPAGHWLGNVAGPAKQHGGDLRWDSQAVHAMVANVQAWLVFRGCVGPDIDWQTAHLGRRCVAGAHRRGHGGLPPAVLPGPAVPGAVLAGRLPEADGVTVTERDGRTFDHRARFDPQSLNFRAAPGVTTMPGIGPHLDARPGAGPGPGGRLRGFGSSGAVAAAPLSRVGVSDSYARNWYRAAQRLDEWPGEAYEGTSVLAGCLEGRRRTMWSGFRWAKRPAELAAGIVADSLGPAIVGVQWSTQLYDVPATGLLDGDVRLDPDLGHCVLLFGFVPAWADCTQATRDRAGRGGAGRRRAETAGARRSRC
jgi:hypothetical protein